MRPNSYSADIGSNGGVHGSDDALCELIRENARLSKQYEGMLSLYTKATNRVTVLEKRLCDALVEADELERDAMTALIRHRKRLRRALVRDAEEGDEEEERDGKAGNDDGDDDDDDDDEGGDGCQDKECIVVSSGDDNDE